VIELIGGRAVGDRIAVGGQRQTRGIEVLNYLFDFIGHLGGWAFCRNVHAVQSLSLEGMCFVEQGMIAIVVVG